MSEYDATRCLLSACTDSIGNGYICKTSIKAIVLRGEGNIEYAIKQAIKAADQMREGTPLTREITIEITTTSYIGR
jgi:tRNA threonylcarbamoyladenosine modification (KEOPS) complex Cgi121 subunit